MERKEAKKGELMLLKNKGTGRIETFEAAWHLKHYASLKDFCMDWEDASEEPKEYWFVNDLDGKPMKCALRYCPIRDFTEWIERRKQIGNYFGTEEEAEKAVEKLKAWHKLMDYWGTEILGWEIRDMPTGGNWQTVNVKFNVKTRKEPMELLDLLFGGEE